MTWLVPRGVKIRSGWRRNGVRTPTLDAVCARVLVAEDDETLIEEVEEEGSPDVAGIIDAPVEPDEKT